MPEDDTIGRIIRRDLDRLPMLPADRWVPRAQPGRGRLPALGARLGRGALPIGAAAFLIIGALVVGSTFRALRASPVASDPQTARAQPLGICAASQDRVLGLSGIVTRLDRIAVKRMTVQDLDAGHAAGGIPPSQSANPLASNTVLCVVAVSGEIRQSFGLLDTGPSKWAVFVFVAGGDEPTISSSMGNGADWPSYFDALPDRVPNPYPGTVVEVVGPNALRVRLESAVLSAEFGNPVLVESNKYTLIQPPGATVAGTGVAPGDRVAIVFEQEGRNPTSGAYALSTFQLTEATLPTAGPPVGYVPSAACMVISFTRASDAASARWTFTCRGLMTLEAWREGLRGTALGQGWRETASQPDVLEFVKDDLRIAMSIETRPSDGDFAVTQRVLRPSTAIRAVMESPTGAMFAQFPKTAGSQACTIRGGGPFPGISVSGTCRTDAQVSGSNYRVSFIYAWDASQFHYAGEPSSGELQHTWSFIVDATGTVAIQPDSGNFPPQYVK
jgi:hypothetical protein